MTAECQSEYTEWKNCSLITKRNQIIFVYSFSGHFFQRKVQNKWNNAFFIIIRLDYKTIEFDNFDGEYYEM